MRVITSILIVLALHPVVSAQMKEKPAPESPWVGFKRGISADDQLMESFALLQKAREGDPSAQNELGYRYLMGKGFPLDTAKAVHWIMKSADQRHQIALYNLGLFQYSGIGMDWNPFLALRSFRAAADLNMAAAMYVVGLFYTDNLVVQRDFEKAYSWEKRSADFGFEPAKLMMAELEKFLPTRDTMQSLSTKAKHDTQFVPLLVDVMDNRDEQYDTLGMLRQILREDRTTSTNAFGKTHSKGDSVLTDSAIFQSIVKAADAGSPEALTVLGTCYQRGLVVPRNEIAAAVLYLRALRFEMRQAYRLLFELGRDDEFIRRLSKRVREEDPDAEFVLAGLYAAGIQYPSTPEQNFSLLMKAASQNHTESILESGICYFWGRGTGRDRDKALAQWQHASMQGSTEARIRILAYQLLEESSSDEKARLFYELQNASDRGSMTAMLTIAVCCETGQGVPLNIPKGVQLYRKAYQRGSNSAYLSLKKLHDDRRPPDAEFQIDETESIH